MWKIVISFLYECYNKQLEAVRTHQQADDAGTWLQIISSTLLDGVYAISIGNIICSIFY